MNNRKKILTLFLFLMMFLCMTTGFVSAYNDEDDDGIDDKFEEINKRDINIIIEANELSIESVRKSTNNKDLIMTNIVYNEDGIRFQTGYKPKLEEDFELIFSISFQELIEFVDLDFDGIYNPEIDENIQNFSLSDFSALFYENSTCPSGSLLHHFKIQTENKTFTVDIYFAEEFTIEANSLLTPTQMKIDINIANFTYFNSSSSLALHSRLDSDSIYEEQINTEDEEYGFAEDEEGLITTIEKFTGFYTWSINGSIDDKAEPIKISEVMPDSENSQKIYLNYPHGISINHHFKIGVEGLLLSETASFLPFVVISLVISSLSVVVVYSIYHAITNDKPPKKYKKERETEAECLELFEEDAYDILFDSKIALQILEGKDAIDKLYHKGDINISVVSTEFYEVIDQFGFEENEKQEFISEMLSLSPRERELILKEVKEKTQ